MAVDGIFKLCAHSIQLKDGLDSGLATLAVTCIMSCHSNCHMFFEPLYYLQQSYYLRKRKKNDTKHLKGL